MTYTVSSGTLNPSIPYLTLKPYGIDEVVPYSCPGLLRHGVRSCVVPFSLHVFLLSYCGQRKNMSQSIVVNTLR